MIQYRKNNGVIEKWISQDGKVWHFVGIKRKLIVDE